MPDFSKENPYSVIFGREPHMVINRDEEAKSIIKVFLRIFRHSRPI